MVKKKNKPHILAQMAGWYGAGAIMFAFMLVSFEVITANHIVYQLLNFSGAIGMIILGIDRHVKQTIVINIFWLTIALISLVLIFIT